MSDSDQYILESIRKWVWSGFYSEEEVDNMIGDILDGDAPDKLKVGLIVKQELERAGFVLDWNETADERIGIPQFDWKRRSK